MRSFNVTLDLDNPQDRAVLAHLMGLVPVEAEPAGLAGAGDNIGQAAPQALGTLDAEAQKKANRQAAAANARAAKNKTPATPPATENGAADLAGPTPEEANGETEDFGLAKPTAPMPTSLSPGEAHDAALALVREIYAANRVAEVKALQKQWGVQKFYDVPLEKAYDFYASAMKVALETGLRK